MKLVLQIFWLGSDSNAVLAFCRVRNQRLDAAALWWAATVVSLWGHIAD
jgi:hypothetical protein